MSKKYDLNSISTKAPSHISKEEAQNAMKDLTKEFDELQNRLYAEGKQSLLIVMQGLDGSGKDGAIKSVFKGINPQGLGVVSFKKPTPEEMGHDFLWRVHKHAPMDGYIQIFNRSHYEEVLVVRVDGYIDDATAQKRFEIINHFEQLLVSNGTQIIKFYMHVSSKEQLERFAERMTVPQKMWKYGPEDLEKHKQREQYIKVYEEALEHCGPDFPWVVVPCDQNWYKEYLILKTIVETLRDMNPQYPKAKIDITDPTVKAFISKYGKK